MVQFPKQKKSGSLKIPEDVTTGKILGATARMVDKICLPPRPPPG